MRRTLVAVASLVVVAVTVVAVSVALVALTGPPVAASFSWVFVPKGVPLEAPFSAWYSVSIPSGAGQSWVQLRICAADTTCVHGVRSEVALTGGPALVTATRSLAPGTYRVSVLLLQLGRLGVPQTVESATYEVSYGQ